MFESCQHKLIVFIMTKVSSSELTPQRRNEFTLESILSSLPRLHYSMRISRSSHNRGQLSLMRVLSDSTTLTATVAVIVTIPRSLHTCAHTRPQPQPLNPQDSTIPHQLRQQWRTKRRPLSAPSMFSITLGKSHAQLTEAGSTSERRSKSLPARNLTSSASLSIESLSLDARNFWKPQALLAGLPVPQSQSTSPNTSRRFLIAICNACILDM